MLRHVFKIVWNRKRANALVGLEIFFSFLVLLGVLTTAIVSLDNVRHPLGFRTADIWHVRMDQRRGLGPAGPHPRIRELLDAARALPEVVAVGATANLPYTHMTIRDGVSIDGRQVPYDFADATDELAEVLGLSVTRGRWFSREDDGAPDAPVVINEKLARDLFGTENPVGRLIPEEEPRPLSTQRHRRVIGVMPAYRVEGAYQDPRGYAFLRSDPRSSESSEPLTLAVRVAAGTPRTFEAQLVRTLHGIAPDVTFTVSSLGEMKASADRETLLPFVIVGVLCAFLLLMVALGLTGVLWESVTRRTREIGVRRALGATAGRVARQIVLEICAVTAFAVVLGGVFAAQLPVLHLTGGMPPALLAAGLLAATLGLFFLASACALYPGWLATRVLPSEALRDE